MGQITNNEFIRMYNKRYGVSRWRQWRRGSKTIVREYGVCPCPECHGNDRLIEGPNSPSAIMMYCERCEKGYYSV